MAAEYKDPQLKRNLDFFKKQLNEAKKGTGSVMAVSGETGFGKTHLLNTFMMEADKDPKTVPIFVEGQAPIGNFNVGNIQPLLPFTKVVEKVLSDPHLTAKQKLLKNLGMTFLASIPGPDLIFYAVKEIGRDWRQFKEEKTEQKKAESDVTQDYFDTICSYADKQTLVILMDDMHWSDAQSVQLISKIAAEAAEIPVLLVFTYRMDLALSQNPSLKNFLEKNAGDFERFYPVELKPFDKRQIEEISNYFLKNYTKNEEFINWMQEHSYGVPGVVIEYMRYFMENPPFDKRGNLKKKFGKIDFMPTTAQRGFSRLLEQLTADERNTLAVCSAEGREFTAMVVSNLLNTDVLTTIKKLRHLQDKTGIIRSIGARMRYGVKTTVYRFTQAFYYDFFNKSLEFEEHVALHGQIAALLKQKYEETESEDIRNEIAPYLAAHSAESGDEETAKEMLLQSARGAWKYGSVEAMREAYEDYVNITGGGGGEGEESIDAVTFREMLRSAEGSSGDGEEFAGEGGVEGGTGKAELPEYPDFNAVRKAFVRQYHEENFETAADMVSNFIEKRDSELVDSEKSQLHALAAKALIELNELPRAEEFCEKAISYAQYASDPVAECFALNVFAVLRSFQERNNDAYLMLKDAAKLAVSRSPELQLLTITNIAVIMKESNPEESARYFIAARKLSEGLDFEDFTKEIL